MAFIYSPNISINQITIRNPLLGTNIDLISSDLSSYPSFDMLTINEDINEPSISGSLLLIDNNNFIDAINLRGGSSEVIIDVTYNFYDGDAERGETKQYAFSILDCKVLNDMADQKVSGGSGTPNKIMIRFASRSYIFTNFGAGFGVDFIGTISNTHVKEESPFSIEQQPNPPATCTEVIAQIQVPGKKETKTKKYRIPDRAWGVDKPKSFISKIVSLFNADRIIDTPIKPLNSDNSFNDVWIKPFNYYYSKFKNAKQPLLTNILNYVKENTILYSTNLDLIGPAYHPKKPIVDFMFWEDLDNYNFKSISNLALENNGKEILYYFDMDENDMGSIASMEVLRDVETVSLFKDGIYASEYVYVRPNWNSPYRLFLDAEEEFTKQLVRYNYTTDIWKSNEGKKQKLPVIARSFNDNSIGFSIFSLADLGTIETPTPFDTRAFNSVDLNFGYFDKNTHNGSHNTPWWSFVGDGPFGFTFNNYYDNSLFESSIYRSPDSPLGITLSYDFSKHMGRYEKEFWHPQFDFSELPGSCLWKINFNIKWNPELSTNRKNYIKLKKLKEKWKIYKEKICCERKIPTSFFALITTSEKIYGGPSEEIFSDNGSLSKFKEDSGGIYAYSWTEIEFWPRSDVTSILANGDEVIKFAEQGVHPFAIVKPRGALEGMGTIERIYKPTQRDETDPAYTPQPNNGGITGLNKKQNENKKYWTKDNRAFNINEILNTVGLTLLNQDKLVSEYQQLAQTAHICKSIITNPGITSRFKPTTEAVSTCASSYPKEFSMMPVGKFKVLSPCGQKYTWEFGRIVQMYAIPKEMMYTMSKYQDEIPGNGITYSSSLKRSPYTTKILEKTNVNISDINVKIKEREKIFIEKGKTEQGGKTGEYTQYGINQLINQGSHLFLFDVENAHDGLCDGTCES